MKVETAWLGDVEVSKDDIFRFESGLPGFELLREFVLINVAQDFDIKMLQSLERREVSFLVSSPFLFYPDYEFELPEPVQQELRVESEEGLIIFGILTVPNELASATINLLAPVILNRHSGLGKQYILRSNEYNSRHPLLQHQADNGRAK